MYNNQWKGETVLDLPNNMQLKIYTSKGTLYIETCASVGHISADGKSVSQVLLRDYSKSIARSPLKRGTEQVIRKAHEEALLKLEQVKADVAEFYKNNPKLIQRPDPVQHEIS